jgi:hypothetical protein
MHIPNGWVPSVMATQLVYDPATKTGVQVTSVDASSAYPTEAERFSSVTPFLAANMAKDRPRRNYIVEPGGRTVYYGDEPAPADPYAGGRRP